MKSFSEFENTPAAFKMLWVEGDIFEMGGQSTYNDSLPVHTVRVNSFWMGEYLVTQALWAYLIALTDKENPSNFIGANRPMENVSYNDIVDKFLPRLNIITGRAYRLPTEAEWEYAVKGGKYGQKYPFIYAGSNKLEEVSWYIENSHLETKNVGLKMPNLLNLYDMSGNVWEWCSDWYAEDFYRSSTAGVSKKPADAATDSDHVLRGGSWRSEAKFCYSSIRDFGSPNYRNRGVGFRLVLSDY